MSEMPTQAEWEAHQAFYKLTVAQRDGAWRESEVLRGAIKAFLTAWSNADEIPDVTAVFEAVEGLKRVLARVEEFVP